MLERRVPSEWIPWVEKDLQKRGWVWRVAVIQVGLLMAAIVAIVAIALLVFSDFDNQWVFVGGALALMELSEWWVVGEERRHAMVRFQLGQTPRLTRIRAPRVALRAIGSFAIMTAVSIAFRLYD